MLYPKVMENWKVNDVKQRRKEMKMIMHEKYELNDIILYRTRGEVYDIVGAIFRPHSLYIKNNS